MMEGEREKLLKLEQVLHRRVIGQDEAVSLIANTIRRSKTGLTDMNRPLGSFIFIASSFDIDVKLYPRSPCWKSRTPNA